MIPSFENWPQSPEKCSQPNPKEVRSVEVLPDFLGASLVALATKWRIHLENPDYGEWPPTILHGIVVL